MRLNLENAENIIKALKRMEEAHGKAYCCCTPNQLTDDIICPCFDAIYNEKCCCGLYKFYDIGGNEIVKC